MASGASSIKTDVQSLAWFGMKWRTSWKASLRLNGRAMWASSTRWRTVFDPQWAEGRGSARVWLRADAPGKSWGAIDRSGHVVLDPQWDRVDLWFNKGGLAIVYNRAIGGVIDKTGRIVIEPKWEAIREYQEGEGAPFYFLTRRAEYKTDPGVMTMMQNAFGKRTIVAAWFDSTGKQLHYSTGANLSEGSEVSPSPQKH